MNKNFRYICAALLALAAAGCATVNTVEPAYPVAKVDKVPDKRIITNNTLNEIAYVVEVDRAKNAGGFEEVQVKLQNTKSGAKLVNYAFEWFDQNGISLNRDPQWHSLSIEGGEIRSIGDVAVWPNAADWRLTLSESVGYSPDMQQGPVGGGYHHQ